MSVTSITCPRCGRTSHHPMDIAEGYCGNCHDWTQPRDTRQHVVHAMIGTGWSVKSANTLLDTLTTRALCDYLNEHGHWGIEDGYALDDPPGIVWGPGGWEPAP